MEEVYRPRVQIYTNVNEFSKFKDDILPNGNLINKFPQNLKDIQHAMNFKGTDKEFEDLCASISLEKHLTQCDDMRVAVFDPSVHQVRKKTMEIRKKALKLKLMQELFDEKLKKNSAKRKFLRSSLKYRYIKHEENVGPIDLIPFNDVIMKIRIYEPFFYKPGKRNDLFPKFCQEFYVLGSNCLTELRDKIYCQCNYGPFNDISENPNQENIKQENLSSGFFFITDTFYNDTRNPNNIDYSTVLLDFWKKQKMNGALKTKKMEETYFREFYFNIGYPQVYQHFGNCEHLLTISNVRLLSKSDSLEKNNYPLLKRVSINRQTNCVICGIYGASFIVTKSSVHIQDPAYLCQNCFESYHYIDGKKIGKFEAYRFYGNRPISNTIVRNNNLE